MQGEVVEVRAGELADVMALVAARGTVEQ